MDDVRDFFEKHYSPVNAIMVVAGAVKADEIKQLAGKWFGPIPAGTKYERELPVEDEQTGERREIVYAQHVPVPALYIAMHMEARTDETYYAADLISDILSRGNSSRLYRHLVKEQKLFSEINAYLTGSLDSGLFIVEGKPVEGVSLEQAEEAIWIELEKLKTEQVGLDELTKVKNKVESTMVFGEMSLLDKAMNLAYFELLGDAGDLNHETARYLRVTREAILKEANKIFHKSNSSTLYYLAQQ